MRRWTATRWRLANLARRRCRAARGRRGHTVQGARGRGDLDRPVRGARPPGPAEERRDLPVSRRRPTRAARARETGRRSEEHTSELQSLAYLVCRLLLEKKKKKNNNQPM